MTFQLSNGTPREHCQTYQFGGLLPRSSLLLLQKRDHKKNAASLGDNKINGNWFLCFKFIAKILHKLCISSAFYVAQSNDGPDRIHLTRLSSDNKFYIISIFEKWIRRVYP